MRIEARTARTWPSALLLHLRTPLYRNAYALMASNVVASGLGFIYWALAARLYRPHELAVDSVLISVLTLLSGISQLNLRAALTRLVPESGRRTPGLVAVSYAASAVVAVGVATVFFLGVALIDPGQTLFGGPLPHAVVLGLIAATVAFALFTLQDGVLIGLRRAVWVPVENGVYGVVKIALLVVFAVSLPHHGILTSFFLPMGVAVAVVSVVLAIRWIPRHVRETGDRAVPVGRQALLRFVAGDYVASLFVLAYTSLLPLLVLAESGTERAAYFYIVWVTATALHLIPVALTASFTVETVAARSDVVAETRRVLLHLVRTLVPIVIVIVIAAPVILQVFGPAYAAEGTAPLRLMALAVLPYGIEVVFFAFLRIHARSREILIIQASLAVLVLGLSWVLIRPFGIVGVAIAWLAAHGVVAAIVLVTRLLPALGRDVRRPAR